MDLRDYGFEHKSLITKPGNLTYSYYLSPNFHSVSKNQQVPIPTLMLLHGYPDDAHMWAGAMPILTKLPYRMIVPDLLGFGGSSKPVDAAEYNYRRQADALSQVLDAEGVPAAGAVIPIGHDWGSATAQRFYLYHRARCVGLCILSLAYVIPSPQPFDLEAANSSTAKRFGYPQWEYWNFFCAPDAPTLMRLHPQRFYEVNHGTLPSPHPEEKGRDVWMREMFCVPGGMRDYVTSAGKYKDFTVQLKPAWNHPQGDHAPLLQRFVERMSRDGFEAPVNYYHSLANNTMLEDEKALCEPDKDGNDRRKITVPMLYIGQTGDWVCRTDLMKDTKDAGLVDDLEEKVVDAGHWVLYEKPAEIATCISDWLVKRFPVK